MAKETSPYPISQLIAGIMDEFGFSRIEFVRALGYRNADRGLRRLNSWLNQGEGYDRIIKQIVAVYGRGDEIEKAIAETHAITVAEYEPQFLERCNAEAATFRPYLHAEGESRIPNGITIFGISGGHGRWTTIFVSQGILELPLEKQLAALPKLMAAYRRKYNGAVPFFRKLTGFKLVRLTDYYQFDRDGQLIGHVEKPFRPGGVEISLR